MKKKIMALVLASMMVGTSVYGMPTTTYNLTKAKNDIVEKSDATILNNQIKRAIYEQGVSNLQSKEMVELLVVSDGKDISKSLENIGAEVKKMSSSVYVVKVEANNASKISKIEAVKDVGMDKILSLPTPISNKVKVSKDENTQDEIIVFPQLEYCHPSVGMVDFWNQGYDGKGTKVAIIDTGVDPKHEMLTMTTEGKLKITDIKDFWRAYGEQSEGDILLEEKQVNEEDGKKYVLINDVKVFIPNSVGEKVLYGEFDESKLIYDDEYGQPTKHHDVNNNGKIDDRIPVIVNNYMDNDKTTDEIYVDTNYNGDLSDESIMGIYGDLAGTIENEVIFEMNEKSKPVLENGQPIVKDEFKEVYEKLTNNFENLNKGENPEGSIYNFAVTEVEKDEDNQWRVNLEYDGHSHGTHVSGDAAGNGYEVLPFMNTELSDGTLRGAAPGAQLLVCRVFQSSGGTPQSVYMAAMEYACEENVDVINLSIGSLTDINDGSELSARFANALSKRYGTIFCIAAGNDGPGINSIGSPGTSEWAFTVGAYAPSYVNYGAPTLLDSLQYFSSMGPTEDGRLKPNFVAPGNMISSYPMWSSNMIREEEEGYIGHGLMQGTSMATPYAAGVMAAIKQAIKEEQIPYHPLVVQEAAFESAKKDINSEKYTPIEIGGGLLQAQETLEYLRNLKKNGLTQESLLAHEGYIDRNEIILKAEFDYTEKLDYKPEGLYVRDGDIPESVDVTIKNTLNKDVNLTLSKDGYAFDTEWLTLPQTELSLKAGESKKLTLLVNREKMAQGINSLLIKMDDSSTVLQEGFIPVTIINYVDLSVENPEFKVVDPGTLRPSESKHYFVRLPYGTKHIRFYMHNDEPDKSGLFKFVTEPSGINSGWNSWWAQVPGGEDEATIYQPNSGTWQMSVYSVDYVNQLYGKDVIAESIGSHTASIRLNGVAMDPSEIRYSKINGEFCNDNENIKLRLATAYEKKFSTDPDRREVVLEKTNLVNLNQNETVERKTISNGDHSIVYSFEVTEENPNVIFKAETSNIDNPFSDDIDLKLWIDHPEWGKYEKEISGNAGSDESIYIEGLGVGKYELEVHAYNTAPTTSYNLTMQVLNNSDGYEGIQLTDAKIAVNKEILEVPMKLTYPEEKGEYLGFIRATNEEGQVLGLSRVEMGYFDSVISTDMSGLPSEIKKGESAKISLDITNNRFDGSQSAYVIVGLYDKNTNKLIKYVDLDKVLKAKETSTFNLEELQIPEQGEFVVRCFVWENLNSIRVLKEKVDIPVR